MLDRLQSSIIESRIKALDYFVKFIASNEHLYCHTYFTRFIAGGLSTRLPSNNVNAGNFERPKSPTLSFSTLSPMQPQLTIQPFSAAVGNVYKRSQAKVKVGTDFLESPLSSDTDSELEGDLLPLIWESHDSYLSKVVDDIQSAKKFALETCWEDAVRSYKKAISGLLNGLNSESIRKEEYRCLLSACLSKVELIHREFLQRPEAKTKQYEDNLSKRIRPSWMVGVHIICFGLFRNPQILFRSVATQHSRRCLAPQMNYSGLKSAELKRRI